MDGEGGKGLECAVYVYQLHMRDTNTVCYTRAKKKERELRDGEGREKRESGLKTGIEVHQAQVLDFPTRNVTIRNQKNVLL